MPNTKVTVPANLRKQALALVASGVSQKSAAAQVGVTAPALCAWVRAAGGVARLRLNREALRNACLDSFVGTGGVSETQQNSQSENLENLPIEERALRIRGGDVRAWKEIASEAYPKTLGFSEFAAGKILTNVANGMPPEIACESIGLAQSAWSDWQFSAQSGDSSLSRWVAVIRIAAAAAVQTLQRQAIEGLAESRGAMWTLQRLRPEIFDPKPPQETQAKASGLRDLPQETIDAILSKRYGVAAKRQNCSECVDLSELGVVQEQEATKQ